MRGFTCRHCQLIAALILGVIIVAFDPKEPRLVLLEQRQKLPPEIGVLSAGKAFALPALQPRLFNGVYYVLRVAVDINLMPGLFDFLQSHNHRQ